MCGGIEMRTLEAGRTFPSLDTQTSNDCNERRVTAVQEKVNKYKSKNRVRKYDGVGSSARSTDSYIHVR